MAAKQKKATRLWYECLIGALERTGLVKNALDQYVVNLIKDGYHCTLCVYVDDILITGVNKDVIDYVVNYLSGSRFQDYYCSSW
jgi:hypothetical protein